MSVLTGSLNVSVSLPVLRLTAKPVNLGSVSSGTINDAISVDPSSPLRLVLRSYTLLSSMVR